MKTYELEDEVYIEWFEEKKQIAKEEIRTMANSIEFIEGEIKRYKKELKKARKQQDKLLEKDVNDFEPKSYVTFGENRLEITDWSLTTCAMAESANQIRTLANNMWRENIHDKRLNNS